MMESGWYWVIPKKNDEPEIAYYSQDVDENWAYSDPWTFNNTEETKRTDELIVLQRVPDYAPTNR